MFSELTRPSTGLSPDFMTRLYTAVALPRMVYAAEVWYLPTHKRQDIERARGLVGVTRKMASIQKIVVLKITGAMRIRLTDVIKIHAASLSEANICLTIQYMDSRIKGGLTDF